MMLGIDPPHTKVAGDYQALSIISFRINDTIVSAALEHPVMELFESRAPQEKPNKNFSLIRNSSAHPAARKMLQRAFESLPKPDGNFVLDFQTSGFDARTWELSLLSGKSRRGSVG